VAISPENFTYVAGFVVPSQRLLRWRHAMVIVTPKGDARLVCVDMEETTVREAAPETDLRVWGEFTESAMSALAGVLRDLGVDTGTVAIEMDYLPAGDYLELRSLAPAANIVPAQGMFDRLRQIKTAGETELMRRLSRLTDQSIAAAYSQVRAGDTELDVAAAVVSALYKRGVEMKLMVLATGERSEYPNVGPTSRALQRGDTCRLEIFGGLEGYLAGICRSAVVQEPSPLVQRIWKNLVECKRILLENIKPGAETRALYELFLEHFKELGFKPISFVGHGIGLHVHEEPYLSKHSSGFLERGMVLGIEPLVYGYGQGFGLQIKDLVAVTSEGCELLSDQTNTDDLIVIP
jgi:ectoine hydrolase